MHDPIELVVSDDLQRNRLTVFFRLLLAIPHLIWLFIWTVIVALAAIVGWVITLATGRLPRGLHGFFCSYVRYSTQLTAYLTLAANPYPRFNGEPGTYPVEVTLPAEPERQSRWRTLFRLLLAVPALLLAAVLGGAPAAAGTGGGGRGSSSEGGGVSFGGVMFIMAFLGWFASLATGRMPSGLRDGAAYGIGYRAQAFAYLLLVTDRYPNADPGPLLATVEPPPVHEVRIASDTDDPRLSRVTVLFRLPLAIPHLVWLALWSVLAFVAVFLQWFVTLFRGRPAEPLHRFLSAWLRYAFHVSAFISLAANPFPGFTGALGTYPLELALPAPGRQNRWKTAFRLVLAIPALFVSTALGGLWIVAAILTWFVGLFLARAPRGLHNLLVYVLRYDSQLYAYLYLVTDAYPHASPLEGAEPAEVPVVPAFHVA
jgi:Domain of unknown function (DUF4389)